MEIEIKRVRHRGIRVKVAKGGKVLVEAASSVTQSEIDAFLLKHRRWLATHVDAMRKRQEYADMLASGDRIMLHGGLVNVYYHQEDGEDVFIERDRALYLYNVESRTEALENWIKNYADDYLIGMFHAYAGDVCPVYVKRAKTYYGVCHRTRQGKHYIVLNRVLIGADDECIRYVIHHEMVHLDVPNHGREFYSRLMKLEPNYKEIQSRLRDMVKIVE